MHAHKITLIIFVLLGTNTLSFSQIPSVGQDTWHGGATDTDFFEDMGIFFLEEEGTCWYMILLEELLLPEEWSRLQITCWKQLMASLL